MKSILIIFFVMISMIEIKAQTSAQLDINNINATVNTIYGNLFQNSNNWAGFEAPNGSGRTSIYMSGFWIGGEDINSQLHLGAKLWQGHDFIPGPMMDFAQYESQIPQWNRIWEINRADVLAFEYAWTNQTSFIVPNDWLNWPAHGNTSLGQAQNLAPFYDRNQDGVYNVLEGDYPLVPGDQCIYYIFNDDTTHTSTGGLRMGIEIQAFVYSFNCPSDSALQNTVFVKYKITNRSTTTFFNTSMGVFTDIDLGGSNDDFIGCNVQNGSYYGYNGDNFDDPFSGSYGYGESLAAQSIVFLGGAYKDADGLDNPLTTDIQNAIDSSGIPYPSLGMNYGDGIADNERIGMNGFLYYNNSGGPQGNPSIPNDFYNYITGYWRDGTHMMYGGSGHSSSPEAIVNGLIETTYMFPGESDPLLWGTQGSSVVTPIWNETNSGNGSGDRTGLGWSGTFTFESGSTEELDIAYVFARDYVDTANNLSPVAIMNSRIDDIRNYFFDQQTPCYTFYTYAEINETDENIYFNLYPNPSSSYFTLEYEGKFQNLNYSVHDILGKEISSGKINSSQTRIDCSDWSNGVYLIKMGDENGYSVKKMVVER